MKSILPKETKAMPEDSRWQNLTDPGRTIPAGRLDGVVHKTRRAGLYRTKFETYCGKPISRDDLLIMMQRLEDITCSECRRHEEKERPCLKMKT
jgi:hypothetical protein